MLLMNPGRKGLFSALEGHFQGQKCASKEDAKDGQSE
jgi:hypothetical protein